MGFYETLLTFLIISLLLGFVYFANGKTLTEKVLAIDFMSLVSAGVMLIYSVTFNDPIYLDVVIVWSLVSFLGTVAFIAYILRDREFREQENEEGN